MGCVVGAIAGGLAAVVRAAGTVVAMLTVVGCASVAVLDGSMGAAITLVCVGAAVVALAGVGGGAVASGVSWAVSGNCDAIATVEALADKVG